MKRIVALVISITIILISGTLFAEQKRCPRYDSFRSAGPPDNAKRFDACASFCRERSCNLDAMLADGWTIEQQRPINITQQPFAVSGQLDFPPAGYCNCQGAEYILNKNMGR